MLERKCLDPVCPCQDGDQCHYLNYDDSKGMPIPTNYAIKGRSYPRILDEDRPDD